MKIIMKSSIALLVVPLAGLSLSWADLLVAQDFSASGIFNSSHWGINAHIPSPAAMDKMVECGITWFRGDFPSSDNNNWGTWDELVAGAEARGLKIFATISPAWAGEPPPGGWDRWEDFVYRIVSHFKGSVRYWGIGNELNSDARWTLDQYVELVKRAYAGAKRADSTSQIVAPEFYYGGDWQQQLAYFLDQALNYVDVIDHHYYNENVPTADAVLQEVDVTRQILDAHGAANKPFWITETGLPSQTWGEEIQANFYTEMCDGVVARPWIQKLIFYDLVDNPGEHPSLWGILRTDLSPKPAFFAYQAAIAAYKKPPVVTFTSPGAGSQAAPLNSVITLEFSRGMNKDNVVSSLVLTPSFDFSFEWEVHKLHLIPDQKLSPATAYQVKVPGTVMSVIGDSLDGNGNGIMEGSPADDFVLSFITGTTGKLPQVRSSDPVQGAVGVPRRTEIHLRFEGVMHHDSVEAAITAFPDWGSGYFNWDRNTVSFYPFGLLKPGTFYTVKLATPAKDRWGYPLDGNGNAQADSLDDFVLYFATTGKGPEIFYPMTGEFPLDFFGAAVGTVKTAKVTIPDTVQIGNIQIGKLRLVTKGLDDTSEVHIYLNGTGPFLLSPQAIGGDNAILSDVSFTGSLLKIGENEMQFVFAKDLAESRSGFQIVPMALVTSYVTAVSEGRGLPEEFALFRNYPNPFNPGTSIRYQVSGFTFVSLKVYDVLGREVKTLVHELKGLGVYDVELEASGLPGGVYFYRLTTSQFTDIKKMLLLR